jgi:hypothetical protein
MANEKIDPNDPMEIMKKQWAAMGIDPTQMAGYMNSAMEMSKNLQEQMAANPFAVGGGSPMSQEDMLKLMDDSPELHDDSDLSAAEIKALACASNSSFHNAQCLNMLSTGMDSDSVLGGLESAWGINNREELISTLEWMEQKGHKVYFDIIWSAVGHLPQKDWKKTISTLQPNSSDPDFDEERLAEFAENLVSNYPALAKKKFFSTMKADVSAWDLARCINLCRYGFDVNYFSREEALDRIQRYAKKMFGVYDSWQSLSEGYITGYTMWNGDADDIEVIVDEHFTLLKHEKSLWTRINW